MPVQRKGLKSIKDLKTHAGTVNQTFLPHKAFMRISCLEMEKAHRIKEVESSRLRIETINERIKEIENEKVILLNRIKNTDNIKADAKSEDITNVKSNNKNNKGLLLKY